MPEFFAKPADFRKWLQKNHATATELWVGYYKISTKKPSITYQESVDQALCFGWIDGIRKSIDAESYMNRFTPRRAGSIWSRININRAQELIAAGLMKPAGAQAFAQRDEKKTNRYSFERDRVAFDKDQLKAFKQNKRAWTFFQAQPPSYRKLGMWWVISARRDATRAKRLATLIEISAAGQRIDAMHPVQKKK